MNTETVVGQQISCIEPTCSNKVEWPEWDSPEQYQLIGSGWSLAVDGRAACPNHSIMKVASAQIDAERRAAVETVDDLDERHIGWLIKVGPERGASQFSRGRTFTLKGVRKWTYEALTSVGLVDPTDAVGNIVGTEYHYDTTVPCELVRPVTAKAKRTAKGTS